MCLEAGRNIARVLSLKTPWSGMVGRTPRSRARGGLEGGWGVGSEGGGEILEKRPIEHRQRTNCSAFDNDSANDPASTSSRRREIGHNTPF